MRRFYYEKRLQGFIAGALSGIILAGGIAIASNTTTLYDVMTNGIKIFVDGQKIYITNRI